MTGSSRLTIWSPHVTHFSKPQLEPVRTLRGIRIVHASTSANMLTAFGRVMAARLIEEGADLYLLASSRPIYGRPADIEELRGMGGTPITVPLESGVRPWNLVSNVVRLQRIFREIKPMVVHTRGSVMGIVGRIAARAAGVPCVVHHQDDLHVREASLGPLKRWFTGRVERWLGNHSDHTFVVSDEVARVAADLGIDASRITNVGHDLSFSIRQGARVPRPPRAEVPILAKHGITETHFLVGAITRLEAHKGVDTLIYAAAAASKSVPTARFLVRGRGPGRERLERLIHEQGIADRFFLVDDWLSDNELIRLYKSFDLFALPTRREGFGMAFAEAMLLGVVPVAPDIPPVNEVVTRDTGLLVRPNASAFADAICWASENPVAMQRLRERASAEAERRWGGTRAADRVIATYQALLEACQPGQPSIP